MDNSRGGTDRLGINLQAHDDLWRDVKIDEIKQIMIEARKRSEREGGRRKKISKGKREEKGNQQNNTEGRKRGKHRR